MLVPGRDVILTTLHRANFAYFAPFVFSLKHAGYTGQLVAFTSAVDSETCAKFRELGVTIVLFHFSGKRERQRLARLWPLWRAFFSSRASQAAKEKLAHRVLHVRYRRYLLYLQFLREYGAGFDRILLADAKDVYFQAEPFSWNPVPGLHFFLEENSHRIGRSRLHRLWMGCQFGEDYVERHAGETVTCSGTTFGDTTSVLQYLERMIATIMKARNLAKIYGGDQGIHNYLLLEKRLPNSVVHPNRRAPVLTLGAMRWDQVQLNAQGLVVDETGAPVPVLHQYDRIPELKKHLLARLPQMARMPQANIMPGSSLKRAWRDRRAQFRDVRRHFLLRRKFAAGEHPFATLRSVLRPRKTILFFPERPNSNSVAYKLCALLGFAITNNPRRHFDVAFKLKDATFCDEAELQGLSTTAKKIVNVHSLDISKRAVARAFEEVFGYAIEVNPTQYGGELVEKSNDNAKHDGRVRQGPLAPDEVRPECVYQKAIDNIPDKNGFVLDYRVAVHGDQVPLVYLKYRPVETRFSNTNTFVKLETPEAVFSSAELGRVLLMAGKMGIDYGEFDVLRDKDHRIYVVDVNNTPLGPPNGLPERESRTALERLAKSFDQFLEEWIHERGPA